MRSAAGRDRAGPGGLRGQLTAAADLFDERAARAIADRFTRVLAAVAADPATRPRQVQVLDDAERAQVLRDWNDTAAEVPAGTLPELVAARAARTPDAVAVCWRGDMGQLRELLGRGRRGWAGTCRRPGRARSRWWGCAWAGVRAW